MHRTLTALLLSSLMFTAAASASPPNDAPASTTRVSTGVTPPQLLNTLVLAAPDPSTGFAIPADSLVTLSFTVDENGQPQDIHILKGVDPYWNSRVAAAAQSLHYRPALLDNHRIPMVVKLSVNVAR